MDVAAAELDNDKVSNDEMPQIKVTVVSFVYFLFLMGVIILLQNFRKLKLRILVCVFFIWFFKGQD